jgi:hypothetical protein
MAMRIAVKYCGGCNPSIDRANLVAKLAMLLAEVQPTWELVSMNEGVYDAIILINGCPVGCVQKQFLSEQRPVFLIAGESLQREQIAEKSLPKALFAKILRLESATEKDVDNKDG